MIRMKKILKNKNVQNNIVTFSISGMLIILFAYVLFKFGVVIDLVDQLIEVLSPFIWGLAFAFILTRFANWLESLMPEKFSLKTKRAISTLVSVLLLIIALTVLVLIVAPQLGESLAKLSKVIVSFSSGVPSWITNLESTIFVDKEIMQIVYDYSNTLVSNIWSFVKTSVPNVVTYTINTASGLLDFIIGIVVTAYILNDRDGLIEKSRRLFKAFLTNKQYVKLTIIYNVSVSRFYKFFKGKLLDSLIIGIICFIAMSFLRLDFAILISFIVGVTNIVPFFGPFIGAVPSSIILLMVDPKQCLIFLIMILILQQIDGNIIGPRILGDSVGLSSISIMFSILVGGAFFGFFGMLLGVPVFSVIYYLVSEEVNKRLKTKKIV